jgi:hypothetical protein
MFIRFQLKRIILKEYCEFRFKLKTEQLEIVEMFWQDSHWISALTSRRAWIQTHARADISLNNTVAIRLYSFFKFFLLVLQ